MQNLGLLADKLYEIRQQRLELQRQVKQLEAEESELKQYFKEVLPTINATGVQGSVACITVTKTELPTTRDWPTLYAYIHEHKAWHLLQRRLNDAAVREMWAAQEQVPGVESFEVQKVSITKL